ncbi:hypothetical protein BJ508DRAFT_71136 [Ascobolus immersus RN42]|uniref:Response regulatory domain-containing protein n=1 Tax=Ascobolus immersus RN42 TaxID=1160509 RepID=A0A3N4IGR3_ASCIM|nr:hypothetical protein BJ508DRAFT_71136 [Ascobolus immersus RN42]
MVLWKSKSDREYNIAVIDSKWKRLRQEVMPNMANMFRLKKEKLLEKIRRRNSNSQSVPVDDRRNSTCSSRGSATNAEEEGSISLPSNTTAPNTPNTPSTLHHHHHHHPILEGSGILEVDDPTVVAIHSKSAEVSFDPSADITANTTTTTTITTTTRPVRTNSGVSFSVLPVAGEDKGNQRNNELEPKPEQKSAQEVLESLSSSNTSPQPSQSLQVQGAEALATTIATPPAQVRVDADVQAQATPTTITTTEDISAPPTPSLSSPPKQSHPQSTSTFQPSSSSSPLYTTAPTSPTTIAPPPPPSPPVRPGVIRRQSLLPPDQAGLIPHLLRAEPITGVSDSQIQTISSLTSHRPSFPPRSKTYHNPGDLPLASPTITEFLNPMGQRRIWVKRLGGSPTLVTINEEDLVDDVRDVILRKYKNALGRSYDPPDLLLRISPSGPPPSRSRASDRPPRLGDRYLEPDEVVSQVLEEYYPQGQRADNALTIELAARPGQQQLNNKQQPSRDSPGRHLQSPVSSDAHMNPEGIDYFNGFIPSNQHSSSSNTAPQNVAAAPVSPDRRPPPIPLVGSNQRRVNTGLPTSHRGFHSSSPTMLPHSNSAPNMEGLQQRQTIVINPRHRARDIDPAFFIPADNTEPQAVIARRQALEEEEENAYVALPKEKAAALIGLPNGAVPPINVLIVEDNIINLKLLEAFMKRLKVRWKSATNGRDAVSQWRKGGFHLVLMDIQLPIMSGLEATREIRRLEAINGIGVLSDTPMDLTKPFAIVPNPNITDADRLEVSDSLFKSPVIIVALTASSLQSDRHEALAVGCNDFLTKPVDFTFLERKVTEWGCMQALIDYDGWRKWKDYPDPTKPLSHPQIAKSATYPILPAAANPRSPTQIKTPLSPTHSHHSSPHHHHHHHHHHHRSAAPSPRANHHHNDSPTSSTSSHSNPEDHEGDGE